MQLGRAATIAEDPSLLTLASQEVPVVLKSKEGNVPPMHDILLFQPDKVSDADMLDKMLLLDHKLGRLPEKDEVQ